MSFKELMNWRTYLVVGIAVIVFSLVNGAIRKNVTSYDNFLKGMGV